MWAELVMSSAHWAVLLGQVGRGVAWRRWSGGLGAGTVIGWIELEPLVLGWRVQKGQGYP